VEYFRDIVNKDLDLGFPWQFILFIQVIHVIWLLFLSVVLLAMTIDARRNTTQGRRNPVRDLNVGWRFIFVFIFVWFTVSDLLTGAATDWLVPLYILALYLTACDEAPPLQSATNPTG
tara:strand:+ start:1665 stop:2018 length:354 start_codon:yes stop_codon:yes gene_type:complete